MSQETEEVCRKLRLTAAEFGQKNLFGAIVIGPSDLPKNFGGHDYINVTTVGEYRLGNIGWKIARFFEDA